MQLRRQIEWNNWVDQYLISVGIQPFDWKTFTEEEAKVKQERLSKMTLEEEMEELSREVREIEESMSYEDFIDLLNIINNDKLMDGDFEDYHVFNDEQ